MSVAIMGHYALHFLDHIFFRPKVDRAIWIQVWNSNTCTVHLYNLRPMGFVDVICWVALAMTPSFFFFLVAEKDYGTLKAEEYKIECGSTAIDPLPPITVGSLLFISYRLHIIRAVRLVSTLRVIVSIHTSIRILAMTLSKLYQYTLAFESAQPIFKTFTHLSIELQEKLKIKKISSTFHWITMKDKKMHPQNH